MEGRGFRSYQKVYERIRMAIVGVSFCSVEQNADFAKRHSFKFPLISDVERRIGIAYGACVSVDSTYPDRISYVISEDGRIQKAYDHVSPGMHAIEVLQDQGIRVA